MSDVETIVGEIYTETRQLYTKIEPRLGTAALGYRVLYGPPVVGAPLLFIGVQPGGRESTDDLKPPETNDYATKEWHLARRIREVWGKDRVEHSTGLNANFFRAPSVSAWKALDCSVRDEVERFCASAAERLTRALRPERIVVIGLHTFGKLTCGDVVLRGGPSALVRKGCLWGAPAYGVRHLTGARFSRTELDALRKYFKDSP